MKLRALIFVSLLGLLTTAYAQVIPARVNVVVLPGQVTAQVYNPFLQPIICNGQVFGQTLAGPVLTTFFTNQIIYPGTDRVMLVQAFVTNPFVTGKADIFCGFARFF